MPAGPVREPTPAYGAPAGSPDWQLLVCTHEAGDDFDRASRAADGLDASPHGRMERLLRHTGVPAGLLFNGVALLLVSAPRGESSGWLDFRVADMLETSGRPIAAALRRLLGQTRLLLAPRAKRLAALLTDSRHYQNDVSERLAEQVLHALYELLRGLQAAHEASRGALLREPLAERPDEVYRALLAVLLRLVFLLYAEQRDMLPDDETFRRAYSLAPCTSACARTPPSTLTPWTSATGRGHSSSPCSASSTTAPGARLGCRAGAAPCSTPTAIRFWRAGPGAPRVRSTSASSRP